MLRTNNTVLIHPSSTFTLPRVIKLYIYIVPIMLLQYMQQYSNTFNPAILGKCMLRIHMWLHIVYKVMCTWKCIETVRMKTSRIISESYHSSEVSLRHNIYWTIKCSIVINIIHCMYTRLERESIYLSLKISTGTLRSGATVFACRKFWRNRISVSIRCKNCLVSFWKKINSM